MSEILLSINVMASNRLDTTEKCFKSLDTLRKEIPCELIVTDTGCGDEMRKLVENYADKIINFEWCRDFAKARQVSVDVASGVYYMYLDDDEWFIDTDAIVDFFRSGKYKTPSYVTYVQRNYHDFHGDSYSDAWVGRMIYLSPETHFEDKIHEHLEPIKNLSIVALNSIVEHYGYINTSKEAERAHYERNVSLLKEMIEEKPKNSRAWVHLAQEYKGAQEWKALLECASEGMKLFENGENAEQIGDLATFYAARMIAHFELGEYDKAQIACKETLSEERVDSFCYAFAHLYVAKVNAELKEYDKARESINAYFSLKKKMDADVVGSYLQSIAIFAGKVFDLEHVQQAYSVELLCNLKQQKFGDLYRYISLLEWDKKTVYIYPNIIDEMVEVLSRDLVIPEQDQEDFGRFLKGVYENKLIWEHVTKLVFLYEATEGYDELPILKKLSSINADDWLISYARMKTIDGRVLEPYFLAMPVEEWMKQLEDHASHCGWLSIANLKEYFDQVKSQDDIRYVYLELYLKELTIIYGMDERELENQKELMVEYAQLMLAFHQMFPEIELGDRVHAAKSLLAAFGAKQEEQIRFLRDTAVAYPEFADTIRKFLCRKDASEKEARRKQQDEMDLLKENLLTLANDYIEKGELSAAEQILSQLKTMLPEDLDVAMLCLKACMG